VSEPAPPDARLGQVCRLILLFRLLALLVTVVYIPLEGETVPLLSAAFVLAALVSYLPMRLWERLGPQIVRHPAFLAGDVVFGALILTLTGPESPFFYYTLGAALLSGVLFRTAGAIFFSLMLLGGYAAALAIRSAAGVEADGFQVLVGLPALYALCAAAGVSVRVLLDRQRAVEDALAETAGAAATSEERSRVAREMHDSLAKTLHGLSLGATALAKRAERDPARTRLMAHELADAAERAAREARELIVDLRADPLDRPFGEAVRAYVERWSESAGIPAAVEANGTPVETPVARAELLGILKEALSNVERHSRARSVRVTLAGRDGGLLLSVRDDGVGMRAAGDPRELEPQGHFGLIGMAERAERLGGRLELSSRPGGGTTVDVEVRPRERSA
jgi:signal transduction histidine kinase